MRRLRTHLGLLGLLALMTLLASFLATAAPRVMHRIEDRAIRDSIASHPASVRDVSLVTDLTSVTPPLQPLLRTVESSLPGALRRTISDRWYAVQSPSASGVAEKFPDFEGKPPQIDLRIQGGFSDAVHVVDGELPSEPEAVPGQDPVPVQVAVSAETADVLHLEVGSTFRIDSVRGAKPFAVTVSGIFEAKDPKAPIWEDHLQTLHPAVPRPFSASPPTYLATAMLHPDAYDTLGTAGVANFSEVSLRYRLDEKRVHAGELPGLRRALGRVDSGGHDLETGYLNTGLDQLIDQFLARRSATLAVVAVVYAGLLGAMLGVLLLAARLLVDRRREELALWRARGASLARLSSRLAADAALGVAPAAVAGWAAAMLIPSRGDGFPWLVVTIAVAGLLAAPAMAVPRLRRTAVVAVRQEVAQSRPPLPRLTAEVTVVLLAVLGVVLLRRRGLLQASGIDPYLSAVPVLLGLAVALVALRAYPWPLRLAGRFAARLRGAVHFLGTARAGRASPAAALPLVVLVIAITVGVFSGVTRASIEQARDQTAWWQVGGDVRLEGVAFDAAAAAPLRDVAGVRALAAMHAAPSTKLYAADNASYAIGSAYVVAVDAASYQRVLDAAGIDYQVPDKLRSARSGDGPLPALVSPAVAKLADTGQVRLGSAPASYRVAGVVDRFPTLDPQTRQFVILPLQALPDDVLTTGYVLAGTDIKLAALVAAAAEEQRRTVAKTGEIASRKLASPTVQTRAERRAETERDGLNQALTVGYAAGTGGAAGFTLLAVGFAIVASARARGRALSRLRTLGLTQRAARGLLIWELTPVLGAAVLAGTALGATLPWLLGPALGLDQFSDGSPPRIVVDPLTVSGLAVLVAVVLAVAIVWEAMVNRRLNLGRVLRVGEDQ